MERSELLKQTRFYKDEESYPEILDTIEGGICGLYWDYERVWVKSESGESESFAVFHKEMVRYLKKSILKGKPARDDVPIGLQAIFVNRIEHWGSERATINSLNNFIDDYLRRAAEYEAILKKI